MKAAFVQTSPVFGETRANVEDALKRLSALGADIAVLPELFSTGYQFRSRKEAMLLAEELPGGYAVSALAGAARTGDMHIVAGIAERAGNRVYNSSVLVGPRGVVGVYRKAHLFQDEKRIFAPGDTPFRVHDVGKARVGMMICFDWLFPEAARTLALRGADVICHPSNLVLPYCPQAMITRSLENRVYSITANRVGAESRVKGKPLRFIGLSQIVAPSGEVLRRASSVRRESRVVTVDVRKARDKNITPVNDVFKDRRTELYRLG
jgi:predicted amidohydrolase